MKERYEYLIDDFGVELVVNEEYTTKNNLYSVKKVLNHLSNTYIIPCDIWCDRIRTITMNYIPGIWSVI